MSKEDSKTPNLGLIFGAIVGGAAACYVAYKGAQQLTGHIREERPSNSSFSHRTTFAKTTNTPGTPNQTLNSTKPSIKKEYMIVSDEQDCITLAQKLKRQYNDYKYVGFDIMSTNNAGNLEEVGLLSLATKNGFCALIRLNYLRGNISSELKEILADETFLKVGVAAVRDAKRLFDDYNIIVKGILDISELASHAGCKSRGLASLADELLNKQINEPKFSNWEKIELTEEDITYAVDLVVSSVKIHQIMRDTIILKSSAANYQRIEKDLMIVQC